MRSISVLTHHPDDTRRLGKIFASWLQPGDSIPLVGEMGSGKTCFVQGVASGLGVGEGLIVNSPSFTLINQYPGRIPLYHVDLFRLESSRDLDDLELIELIHGDGVTLIEWPDLILSRIPELVMHIDFFWDMTSETDRLITFVSDQKRFDGLFKELSDQNSRY